MRKASNQARPDRIGDGGHDDGDAGRGTLGRLSCNRNVHEDHVYLELDEFLSKAGQTIGMILRCPKLDGDIAALHVTQLTQSLSQVLDNWVVRAGNKKKYTQDRNFAPLLRPRGGSRNGEIQRQGEQNNPPSHPITSPARNTRA
jgi:hypothetical protein